MKAIVILTSCFLFLTCKKEEPRSEWTTFDFGIFTVEAPSEWHKFTGQGYDSKVGGLTDKKDTVRYDYGMYSSRFSTITSDTHIITESNRDGYPTKMVKPKKAGDGVKGIIITSVMPSDLPFIAITVKSIPFRKLLSP